MHTIAAACSPLSNSSLSRLFTSLWRSIRDMFVNFSETILMLKWVSVDVVPCTPACPLCMCDSLVTVSAIGVRESVSFLSMDFWMVDMSLLVIIHLQVHCINRNSVNPYLSWKTVITFYIFQGPLSLLRHPKSVSSPTVPSAHLQSPPRKKGN